MTQWSSKNSVMVIWIKKSQTTWLLLVTVILLINRNTKTSSLLPHTCEFNDATGTLKVSYANARTKKHSKQLINVHTYEET